MESEIKIVTKRLGHVLEIEESVSMFKMPSIMGQDYGEILEHAKALECGEMGIPYTRYLNVDWDVEMNKGFLANLISAFTKKWHFMVGVPFESAAESSGRMVAREFEEKSYIETMHYGPYHKVGDTYKLVYEYAHSNGICLEEESIEFYLNDPSKVKKEELETAVYVPIKSQSEVEC